MAKGNDNVEMMKFTVIIPCPTYTNIETRHFIYTLMYVIIHHLTSSSIILHHLASFSAIEYHFVLYSIV